MFSKPKKEIKPIDRSELIFFTQQLRNFIEFYEKFIFIKDSSTISKLDLLKQYASILTSERYDMLINDTSIIHNDISTPTEPRTFIIRDNKLCLDPNYINAIIADDDLPF